MLQYDAIPKQLTTLLKQLVGNPALEQFALGGGTSLALRFAHRVSVDLDFFTLREFEPDSLMQALNLPESTIVAQANNSLTLDVVGVKIDFLRHNYELLAPVESEGGINLLSVPDVIAMKLNAIANRGSKKDFFDIAELLDHNSIDQLLEWFELKYPQSDRFIVIRSLGWFGDAETEPDPISLRKLHWPEIQERIASSIEGLH
jgi:predicted nucleotidyltransferase component of viral defense system